MKTQKKSIQIADDWWNQGKNTITGFQVRDHRTNKDLVEQKKYHDAYPSLDIKTES